jgi:hypothetical protein
MAAFPIDDFIDDGMIFIWVVSCMGTEISKVMDAKGWRECGKVIWNKYDRYGRPLFRGGYDMMHVYEECYVFKRKV